MLLLLIVAGIVVLSGFAFFVYRRSIKKHGMYIGLYAFNNDKFSTDGCIEILPMDPYKSDETTTVPIWLPCLPRVRPGDHTKIRGRDVTSQTIREHSACHN